ncbi:MAG: DUF2924 domain-containing protein [Candidatus Binatus sp.]|uniref:DUF2924 domain-containing protein n=1 Tax=Candidatus Binatus sp. TaxID=2811406 RepID=UPI0027156AED|nr:DUF2924 domain-containing protein [Candidatus Binatus sp.]MDO8434047.1 DUF2924 domain-containing protein [Candidatus Binatus sp.]
MDKLKVAKHREKRFMKRRAPVLDLGALSDEISGLSKAGITDLRERWKTLYGREPSGHIGRSSLIRVIAYRLQEGAFGGLKPSAQRILDRVCDGRGEVGQEGIPQRRASAGTVLIREWRGVSHRVTVLDNDVVYRGRRYKSLSEVARAITGTRWSGPLFFGLKRRAKEAVRG